MGNELRALRYIIFRCKLITQTHRTVYNVAMKGLDKKKGNIELKQEEDNQKKNVNALSL